jgi:hypothetical protein
MTAADVRVVFEDLSSGKAASEPVVGRLRTGVRLRRDVTFGYTTGQGRPGLPAGRRDGGLGRTLVPLCQ